MNSGRIPLAQILGALAALMAPAASIAAGRCIDRDASWVPLDDHRILASSGRSAFLVTTNVCPRLNAPLTHLVISDAGGGTPVCKPHDVRLYISDGAGIRTPCSIQSISPLSQDEARELQAKRP
jgi:hypothetical protein